MTNRFETKLVGSDRHFYRELFKRNPGNPILSSKDWPYAANTVFNPAATMYNGKVLLLARVEDRRGFSHLTKAVSDDGINVIVKSYAHAQNETRLIGRVSFYRFSVSDL